MDEVLETTQRTDAQLIADVRGGDTDAYGQLYERHVDAATRLARHLLTTGEADDLVSEAFLRVLRVLQDGRGPDEAFRAYLLTSLRRLHLDRVRATARTRPTDDEHVLDQGVPFEDAVAAAFENDTAARAFSSLPERWQLVLWHVEVEGQKPAAVAPLLGMSPNAVSALAYRAREGLRAAYLEHHAAATTDDECRVITPLLGGFVRQTLSARDTGKVDRHLDGCRRCAGVHLELVEVNQNLRALIAPALLGPAAAGYLGATGVAAGAVVGAGGLAAGGALATAGSAVGGSVAAGSAVAGTGFAAASGYAGATMLTSAIVSQVARVALVPAQAAAATVVSAGAPAVVATTVVTGALTTGVVVGTTDLLSPGPPALVTAPSPSATPLPEATTEPAPTEEPTPAPTTEPSPSDPAPSTDPLPSPSTDPTAGSTEPPGTTPTEPTPEPSPTPPPVTPTDFGLGSPSITNDSAALQRRVIVPISADGGSNPVARTVTVTVSFQRQVSFRGIPGGAWACDATRGQRVRSVTCSTELAAGQGGEFPFKVASVRPAGTITLTAPDDLRSGNDVTSFTAKGWLLPI